MLRQTVTTTPIPPTLYAHFNELYDQAHRIITLLTATTRRFQDQDARIRIANLVEAVGESLVVSSIF